MKQVNTAWPLPESPGFKIRETSDTGRAVFAQSALPPATHVLTTSPEQSPLSHVILRSYRREVCAWCFAYDRGREWKIRNAPSNTAFCTAQCQSYWLQDNDKLCQEAIQRTEAFIKFCCKRQKVAQSRDLHSSPTNNTQNVDQEAAIAHVWTETENEARTVLLARSTNQPSKAQRAALRKVSDLIPDPDILTYVLSGVLATYRTKNYSAVGKGSDQGNNFDIQTLLPSLSELVPDDRVFVSNPMTPSPLRDYTSSYLVLLTTVPDAMLQLVSPTLIVNLASRASHNAFSIRPEGASDGDQSGEFLGWGVWPEASFFNHSCCPNLSKERRGRFWSFKIHPDQKTGVADGDQLCITYLGGDERELDVTERRKRLSEQWGFLCLCQRCRLESSGI